MTINELLEHRAGFQINDKQYRVYVYGQYSRIYTVNENGIIIDCFDEY